MRAIIAALIVITIGSSLLSAGPALWWALLFRLLASVPLAAGYLILIRSKAKDRRRESGWIADSMRFRLATKAELARAQPAKPKSGSAATQARDDEALIRQLDALRHGQCLIDEGMGRAENRYNNTYMLAAAAALLVGVSGLFFPETAVVIVVAAGVSLWRSDLAAPAHAAAVAGIVCWFGCMPLPVAAAFPATTLLGPCVVGGVSTRCGGYVSYAAAALMLAGMRWDVATLLTAMLAVSAMTLDNFIDNKKGAAVAIP